MADPTQHSFARLNRFEKGADLARAPGNLNWPKSSLPSRIWTSMRHAGALISQPGVHILGGSLGTLW